MFTILLSLLFIIRLKLKSNDNGFTNFFKRYGVDGQLIYRNLYNNALKLSKSEFDLDILQKCKIYNVFPKFLQFKLYKRTLQTLNFYKSQQAKLLLHEIKIKKRSISNKKTGIETHRNSSRTNFYQIYLYLVNHLELQKRNKTAFITHRKNNCPASELTTKSYFQLYNSAVISTRL